MLHSIMILRLQSPTGLDLHLNLNSSRDPEEIRTRSIRAVILLRLSKYAKLSKLSGSETRRKCANRNLMGLETHDAGWDL